MSEALTDGVSINVECAYISEQSRPEAGYFFFAYRVKISNEGEQAVKLVSRHWVITDALGKTEEVRGKGVVGKQPLLTQGQSFTYTSACPLPTPTGTMHGSYQMIREDGHEFDAVIAPFKLTAHHLLH